MCVEQSDWQTTKFHNTRIYIFPEKVKQNLINIRTKARIAKAIGFLAQKVVAVAETCLDILYKCGAEIYNV